MMTYRSLKSFVKKNTQSHNNEIFDLIPTCVKSKIIFIVGDGRNNTAAYLSSVMSSCEIKHFHFKNDDIDINKMFLQGGVPISVDVLCEKAEFILKTTKKILSNEDLFCLIALSLCDSEYAIIEISEEYYTQIKDFISPFALILALQNNDKVNTLIENTPKGIKEIIALWTKDNFDYISNKFSNTGARISLASPNKIIVSSSDLLSTSFYHYDYLYRTSAIDLNNISFAHLAIEAARILFSAPRPYIYKGIEMARIPHDLNLYSLSPTVLLREGENNFKLHHKLKFKTVTESDEFEIPRENTIFCGGKEYIEQIKEKLKKR